MIIESKDRNGGPKAPIRQSTLNLIDLAGSENSKMTGSTGVREQEGKFINQSLLALSTIIQRLSEAKTQHLPFRDSKLTRILQEPLSGNAVIAIICTVSPALRCCDETHNTLKFATRLIIYKLYTVLYYQLNMHLILIVELRK
jgi:centromeric protein E